MTLGDNKRDRILDKVYFANHYTERNVRKSDWDIGEKQGIWVEFLLGSNDSLINIYIEIKRKY